MSGARSAAALWPLAGIVALLAFNAIADVLGGRGVFGPGAFLHVSARGGTPAGALLDVLNYGGAIAIIAIGMTPVIATRGVDLSVGSVMAISAAVGAVLVREGIHGAAAVAAAIGAGMVCGIGNGLLVGGGGVRPFVATLVLMVAGRGIAQMITGSQIATFHDGVIEFLGLGRVGWMPMPFVLAAGLLGAAWAVARRTPIGSFVEMLGSNPRAAGLIGLPTGRVLASAYGFCGACAGLAGVIAAANIKGADPFNAGRNAELAAIFAVVVGGTSLGGGRMRLAGAFVGAMLLQCLVTTMYARDVSADVAPLPMALVILGVCVAGSGRFGRARREGG